MVFGAPLGKPRFDAVLLGSAGVNAMRREIGKTTTNLDAHIMGDIPQ
jgi:hypothetical protein